MTPVAVRRWLQTRRGHWQRIDDWLREPRQRFDTAEAASQIVTDYRALARDVALARRELPGSEVTLRLEGRLRQAHALLHRDYTPLRERLLQLYGVEIPDLFRRLLPTLRVVVLIFAGFGVATWMLVSRFPELAALFVSEGMIETVERGQLWTDGLLNVVPSSMLSAGIIRNNVSVALMTFLFGAFYGVGTLYMLALNGAMLGCAFAFTAHYGLAGGLFRFIIAHGVVELSVIMLASAAGVRLGEALARPGQRTRVDAFRSAVSDAGKLLAVVVPFLGLAGLIEGFVSPDANYGLPLRLVIGAASGTLLWLVLSGQLYTARRRRSDS